MRALRIRRGGYFLALGLTVLTLVGCAVGILAVLVGADKGLWRLVVGFGPLLIESLWIVVVGTVLWPRYSLLVRAFRSN